MTKADLYRLVDELPESAVGLAARLLEVARDEADPVARALQNAPEDDEPLTPEDEAAIAEAMEDVRAGRLVPHEQLWRELEREP